MTPHPPRLEDLNLEGNVADNLLPESGLVLIASPASSGKTTLLSASLRHELERPEGGRLIALLSRDRDFALGEPSDRLFELKPDWSKEGYAPGSVAWAVHRTFAWAGGVVAVDSFRSGLDLLAAGQVASKGHAVIGTTCSHGIAAALSHAVRSLESGITAERARASVTENLHMVVAQHLLPRLGGGTVACREYLVLDADAKAAFAETDADRWRELVARLIGSAETKGRSLACAAESLLGRGMISGETYRNFTAAVAAA